MSNKYLNELKIHWKISNGAGLTFYGLTKDLETKEFMMIIQFADEGNLRSNEDNKEKYGYKGNEIKAAFEEADKEIPNISTSTLYVNNEVCDSQLIDLEVSNSIQLRGAIDIDDENKVDDLVN
ncbi:kinase-like domain-containing protein [Rhizophagus irregularis DAOM 181602=DAOM 197198]|nr:kinase-like domain-containing protein [Rhizophagus irregularis DAOM 181602=DAOM 197198]